MAFADAEIPFFLLSIGYLYLFDYELVFQTFSLSLGHRKMQINYFT